MNFLEAINIRTLYISLICVCMCVCVIVFLEKFYFIEDSPSRNLDVKREDSEMLENDILM